MWKKILDYFTHLLTLAQATQENKAEIKELRQELRDLTYVVHELRAEFRTLRGEQQHNLEKVVLKLENELLRFERRLPPGKGKARG
jgi:hypothetical protein